MKKKTLLRRQRITVTTQDLIEMCSARDGQEISGASVRIYLPEGQENNGWFDVEELVIDWEEDDFGELDL